MPICPNQHESRTPDFCEVCGVEIPPAAGSPPVAEGAGGVRQICPACHAEHDAAVGDFCEVCGYNFKTGPGPVAKVTTGPKDAPREDKSGLAPLSTGDASPPPAALPTPRSGWELVIAVAAVPHAGMSEAQTPPAFAERVVTLDADSFLIGRRSIRRNIVPEISLDHDDGISHRHAQLTRGPDGSFSLSDLASSNGTTLNGADVPPGTAVPLKEGDAVTLGCWTRLTLRRPLPSGNTDSSPSPGLPSASA